MQGWAVVCDLEGCERSAPMISAEDEVPQGWVHLRLRRSCSTELHDFCGEQHLWDWLSKRLNPTEGTS